MSKIGELLEHLKTGKYTKEELAALTGLKESTVGVQISYHLKMKGYNVQSERVDGVKKYFITGEPVYVPKEEANDDEEVKEPADAPLHDAEPAHEELEQIAKDGDDEPISNVELDALLDE